MKNKKPPFEITNQIIDYVAEIAELVGRLTASPSSFHKSNPAPCQPHPHHPWLPGY